MYVVYAPMYTQSSDITCSQLIGKLEGVVCTHKNRTFCTLSTGVTISIEGILSTVRIL